MSIKFKETSLFLSCDDKAKIDHGEPCCTLSTGVRERKSIVPLSSSLQALDHDVNQKGSITPTVNLLVDITDDINESFYRGQVSVCLKDSVFQPDSRFRSTIELLNVIKETVPREKLSTCHNFFMITDGGTEHRVNFHSVKIPLILLFKELKLDSLVAIRTTPGHSYCNIVERIMSILDIGLQNVALEQDTSLSDEVIKKLKNLDNLRKHPEIKNNWQDKRLFLYCRTE